MPTEPHPYEEELEYRIEATCRQFCDKFISAKMDVPAEVRALGRPALEAIVTEILKAIVDRGESGELTGTLSGHGTYGWWHLRFLPLPSYGPDGNHLANGLGCTGGIVHMSSTLTLPANLSNPPA